MSSNEMQKAIYRYLEILVCETTSNEKSSTENENGNLLKTLLKNAALVKEECMRHNHFNQELQVELHQDALIDQQYWYFVVFCLKFLKALYVELASVECVKSDYVMTKEELLSVNQQEKLKKVIQFIIVFGIVPNVMPSVQKILKTQLQMEKIGDNMDFGSANPQTCYFRLSACLLVLLKCLEVNCLQQVILPCHASHLLLVLFQVCYAPIKKCTLEINEITIENLPESVKDTYKNLDVSLSKVEGCEALTEEEIIKQMHQDRIIFKGHLENLIHHTSQTVLIWELLILQNSNLGNSELATHSKMKTPAWLQNVCNEMLTNKLIGPHGIKQFLLVVFDNVTDSELKDGTITMQKIEAVSRLISSNPVKNMSKETYLQKICSQIPELLHSKHPAMNSVFSLVASCIALQLYEADYLLAETYLSQTLFEPFRRCLHDSRNALFMDGEMVVSEDNLTQSIEDVHKIFILCQSILNEDLVKVLIPFYHLLFCLYAHLQNGISFLKSKLLELLLTIFNNCSIDYAVNLLEFATFEDSSIQYVHRVRNLNCIPGDSGGVKVVVNTKRDDIFDDVESKCQALVTLIHELKNKKLKMSYFLMLLEKATCSMDTKCATDKNNVDAFIDHLITLNLMEELSDVVGKDIGNNVNEAVNIIMVSLKYIEVKSTYDPVYNPETTQSILVILSTIIGYQDQLTSEHWNSLKRCLTSLELICRTSEDDNLKNIAEDICVAIRTHGAVLKSDSSQGNTSHHFSRTSNTVTEKLQKTFLRSDGTKPQYCSSNVDLTETVKSTTGENSKKPLIEEIGSSDNVDCSKVYLYKSSMQDAKDENIPTRGHGLIYLSKLLEARDIETMSHKKELIEIFKKNLSDDDSYIYLSAIRGVSALGEVDTDVVLPLLLEEFQNPKGKWDYTLKIGEAILRICKNLGELTPKFRKLFLNTFLTGAQHEDYNIRVSSLSNLAEVCKNLKFSLVPNLHEVLACVKSLLKFDPNIEVRRSAALVLRLLLQGVERDALVILKGEEMNELYSFLKKLLNQRDIDETLKLHLLMTLEEIGNIVKLIMTQNTTLVKEIKIFPS